jgi:hypothetical protein
MKPFLLLVLLLSCSVAFSQAKTKAVKDPWTGTYKLDTSKSTFSGPAPREETIDVASARKNSIKYTIAGKDVNGDSYTINYEGKAGVASPEMMEGKTIAQITYQMPSSHKFTAEGHGTDGSTSTGAITLSSDGKTITVEQHNKTDQGAQQDNTLVYVRQ